MSLDELKKALKEKTLVLGADRTLKRLQNGKCKKVFLASNCPENLKRKIKSWERNQGDGCEG